MAKRKTQINDETVAPIAPVKTPKPAVPVAEYETGAWSGRKQYRCKLCAFDVLENEPAMLEHLLDVHNSAAAMRLMIEKEQDNGTN